MEPKAVAACLELLLCCHSRNDLRGHVRADARPKAFPCLRARPLEGRGNTKGHHVDVNYIGRKSLYSASRFNVMQMSANRVDKDV
jgi:hypothetical protein